MTRLHVPFATILSFTLFLFVGATVFAGSTTTYTTVSYSGDTWYNWDNTSQSCACSNAVDWPVTMIFRTYANVNRVKDILGGYSGSSMYLRANDGNGWFWDSDGGRKLPISGYPTGYYHHVRLYAPYPADYFYSTAWGRYVLATTHIDWNEFSSSRQFGWSETAEEYFAAFFRNRGYSVTEDTFWMANNDSWPSGRWGEGNRNFYLSNGYATIVVLP